MLYFDHRQTAKYIKFIWIQYWFALLMLCQIAAHTLIDIMHYNFIYHTILHFAFCTLFFPFFVRSSLALFCLHKFQHRNNIFPGTSINLYLWNCEVSRRWDDVSGAEWGDKKKILCMEVNVVWVCVFVCEVKLHENMFSQRHHHKFKLINLLDLPHLILKEYCLMLLPVDCMLTFSS